MRSLTTTISFSQLEFARALEKITKEVRDAYLSSISAEQLIIETTAAVKYAEEGLRLAELRFQEGVGTYLDVINAQHSYTDSLIDKANALIDFDEAQVRLVHALGVDYGRYTDSPCASQRAGQG